MAACGPQIEKTLLLFETRMDDSSTTVDNDSIDVAKVIFNRGRQVDIHNYILNYPDELIKGVLVAGSIGSGKTQRAMQVILAALESKFGVVVFDPSGDHGRLVSVFPDTVVLDFREFIINPLEPPKGMRIEEWIPTFIQVFAQNYGLKDPSIAILQKAMNSLLLTNSDVEDNPPTLQELLEEVQQYEPRLHSSEVSSHVSVQNRLESLLDSEVGKAVNVRMGFQPVDFEKGLLIIQLPSSGITRAHELVVGITIAKLFAYRAWLKRRVDAMESKILIVLEEAHNYLSEARRADRQGERSQLERSLIEGRKLDIGFLIIDQMPQRISSHVLGSCNMWIVGRLIDPAAKSVIGDALCLDAVWSRDGLISLPTGGAFIRVEHMRELEAKSPLEHWSSISENQYWSAKGLPAIVAVPNPQDQLIPEITHNYIKNLMCNNERYMGFFERYASQYIERIRSAFPDYIVKMLERFLQRNIKQIDDDESSILEYYGLSSDNVNMLLSREQNAEYLPQKMSMRSQIHDLEIRCRILSSEATREVLTVLESSGVLGVHEISQLVHKSKSWLSRILRELESRGFITRETKVKERNVKIKLTKYGKELLLWARTVSTYQRSEEGFTEQGKIVEIDRNFLDWLIELLAEEMQIREHAYIAGWRGSEEMRELLSNLEFRVQILAGVKSVSSRVKSSSFNADFFQRVLAALESHVLRILLKSQKSVRIADLPSLCRISDRSVRRNLSVLGELGMLLRQRKDYGWSVSISESWKQLLLDDCDPSKKRVPLTLNILNTLLEHAVDNALLEMFVEDSGNLESIEYVILKCLDMYDSLMSGKT